MNVLAVIPARGGSKSIPLKNIKDLCAKPLLAYAIESAQASQLITKLVVSTDHPAIADIASDYGCQVVQRPAELSRDESPTEDALIHALEYLKKTEKLNFDVVLTLEPTSPFRTAATIDRCVELFRDSSVDSVIAVVETRSCYGKIVNNKFEYLFPHQPRRRQERTPLYRESSTIYGTRTEVLVKKRSVLGDKLYPLIIEESEAFDINTELDFAIAQSVMELKLKGELP